MGWSIPLNTVYQEVCPVCAADLPDFSFNTEFHQKMTTCPVSHLSRCFVRAEMLTKITWTSLCGCMSFLHVFSEWFGLAWMRALIHFHCGTHLCEETPGISPDQLWAPVSHTPSLYPYSGAQQLGLGQTFELNTGIKSFSQHKTPQFTGSTLSHPLHPPALILKPGPLEAPHTPG